MRLSPAAELAIRGAVVLASEHGRVPTPLKDICERRDLPREYLVKIFSMLTKAGLVTPVRGKKGGYVLARQSEQISLLDVIEAVEGKIAMNYCQQEPPQCDDVDCPIRPVWADLQQTVRAKLAGVSLAQCVRADHQAEQVERVTPSKR
jgi:Rrf2 family protein